MRIAFATTDPEVLHGADRDRPLHEEAFARAGIDVDYRVWWDPGVEWDRYDLVVIRSTWDYVPRLTEYRRWLRAVDRLGTLRNPAALVEWNIDKRYLWELGAAGVPVIPTRVASSEEELASVLAEPVEHVVKPVVSAGSADTGRFAPGDPGAVALGRRVLSRGVPVMVQPSVPSVATDGEIRAVLFGSTVSHSFRKGPVLALGGGEHHENHEEDVAAEGLSAGQEWVVGLAIEAVGRIAVDRFGVGTPLLYARIDMVRGEDGEDMVLEVELNEPSFFLPVDDRAADRFVAATMAQLGS